MIEYTFGYPIKAIIALVSIFSLSLYIDFIGHNNGHTMSIREATLWSIGWIAIACFFGLFIYIEYGGHFASLYFAGYIVEKTLSVDNIIVFTAIFSSFGIHSQKTQHTILLWGIVSAIILRALFTFLGAHILSLHWSIQLVFAGIILLSGISMLKRTHTEHKVDYTQHRIVRCIQRFFPITHTLHGSAFFVRQEKLYATPVFICLCVIELSDVLFAFDSVPAVFAITQEPFLVYSAMLFAIMGLRSLYFVLQGLITQLIYLEKAIVILLFFIAGKMVLAVYDIHIPLWLSLTSIITIIIMGILVSLIYNLYNKRRQ